MEMKTICAYCGQKLYDLHSVSGYTKGADWATQDGDFGCDYNPENTEDGVGSHKVEEVRA